VERRFLYSHNKVLGEFEDKGVLLSSLMDFAERPRGDEDGEHAASEIQEVSEKMCLAQRDDCKFSSQLRNLINPRSF